VKIGYLGVSAILLDILLQVQQGMTFHFWAFTFLVSAKILFFFWVEKRIFVFLRKPDLFLWPFLLYLVQKWSKI